MNYEHVPIFGVVVFAGLNAHTPSEPPPKQDSLEV